MNWQWTPYTVPMLLAATASLMTAGYLYWKRRHRASSRVGILLLLASTVWMLGSVLQLSNTSLAAKVFWDKVQFVGICILPAGWLAYVLRFTGHADWLTPRNRILLSIVPLVTFLLVLTNQSHELIWTGVTLDLSGPYATKRASPGAALWAYQGYASAMVLAGVLILVRALVRVGRLYRWQAGALLMAAVVPWLVNVIEQRFGLPYMQDTELTPLALGVTLPVLAWSLFRLQRRDLGPIARDRVVEAMADALLVLDGSNRVIDLNPAARALIGHRADVAGGLYLEQFWPAWQTLAEGNPEEIEAGTELVLPGKEGPRSFDVSVSPLLDRNGQLISRVVILRDITSRKQAEDALRRAEQEARRHLTEQVALREASMAIVSTLDLSEVLSHIAEQMGRAIEVTSVYINTADLKARTSTVVAEYYSPEVLPEESVSDLGVTYEEEPGFLEALSKGQPSSDHIDDPDLEQSVREHLERYGAKSVLYVPLFTRSETLGYAELWESRHRREFTPEEIGLCRALAVNAAMALEHAGLHAETERRLQEQVVLRQAGAVISSSLDLETVLGRIAEQLCWATDATSAYILGHKPEEGTFTVLAEYLGPLASDKERISDRGVTYEYSEYDAEFVRLMEIGQHDTSHVDDPDLPEAERAHMEQYGAQSILYVPLLIKGHLIGYAELWESRRRREFTRDEVALCQAIAQQAAIALEHARLYAAELERTEELALAGEQLRAELDVRERVERALRRSEAALRLYSDRLALLREIDRATLAARSPETISAAALKTLRQLLPYQTAMVLTYNQKAGELIALASSADLEELGMGTGSRIPLDLFEGAKTLVDRIEQGETLMVEDVRQVPQASPLVQFGLPIDVRSVMAIPLMAQDKAMGVLGFGADTPGAFTLEHQEIASEVADELAVAIQQALLGVQLQRHAAALEHQTRELERSNAELQQFAYVASHDLQEPLRMVTSYLQLLERRYKNQLDADADDFIEYAVEGATRMHELIKGLLDYSRVGTHGLPLQSTDLSLVLDQVLDSLQVTVRETEATVSCDPLPVVMADATQMQQLFQNLIGNAIKFHGESQPEIHVGADRRDGSWIFSVRDNGIGLEPQYADRIFVIFQRLHTRDKYPGTGIGLAICKRIVERHGGQIWVESAPGQGSTFYFSMPDGRGG